MEQIIGIISLISMMAILAHGQYQQQQHQQQMYQQQAGYGQVPQQQGYQPQGQVQYQQTGHAQGMYGSPQQGGVPQQPHLQAQQMVQPGQNILHDSGRIHDKAHLKEHIGTLDEEQLSKMSEEELQFHYFKLHDNDNNNKLDGCELIKSLIHWHVEEHKHLQATGAATNPQGTTKIFTDAELAGMIDPILGMDDKNMDGYIDYPEFIAAQKARGF